MIHLAENLGFFEFFNLEFSTSLVSASLALIFWKFFQQILQNLAIFQKFHVKFDGSQIIDIFKFKMQLKLFYI